MLQCEYQMSLLSQHSGAQNILFIVGLLEPTLLIRRLTMIQKLLSPKWLVAFAMIGLMARRLAPAPGRRPWQPTTAA